MSGVIAILVMFAVLLVGLAVYLFNRARQIEAHDAVRLRLRAIGSPNEEIEESGNTNQIANPLIRNVAHRFWRAGINVEASTVVILLWVVLAFMAVSMLVAGVLAGVALSLFALLLVVIYLARATNKRRMSIIHQLPDYLEHMLRALSAGSSLENSLSEAAKDAREPSRTMYSSVARQVRLGAAVDEVLRDQAEVNQIRDLYVLSLVTNVNRRYGGSLKRIVKSLATSVRSRESAARELSALTAETRFSAWVVGAIPIGLMLYILGTNPDYYTNMWNSGWQMRALLVGTGVWVCCGILVLWRMMRSVQD